MTDQTIQTGLTEASVIERSGQAENRCIVLFNGIKVNTLNPEAEAFTPHAIAVSLFNIPRWNGHFRLDADWNPERCLSDGEGGFYAFYPVMSHCVLVALCACYICIHEGIVPPANLARNCYLHEIPEMLIGDIPGPFKRPIKRHVKPIEQTILTQAYNALDFAMPDEAENALIKRADIMAQDIEAYHGIKAHIRGVTLSNDWTLEGWMADALRLAARAVPSDFVRLVEQNIFPTIQPTPSNGDPSSEKTGEEAHVNKQSLRAVVEADVTSKANMPIWGVAQATDVVVGKEFLRAVVEADVTRKANMPSWDITQIIDAVGKAGLFSYARVASLLGFPHSDPRVIQTIQWLISISRITPVFYFNEDHRLTLDDVDDTAKTVSEGLLNALNGVAFVNPETGEDIDLPELVKRITVLFEGVSK